MTPRQTPIQLFQFARMFGIPNVSPFCCKLETWLRIAKIPYEIVETDPRKGPLGKVPFIEDAGQRMGDTSLIIEHLSKTRGVDPDAHLDSSQRALAVLVQRTIEEHYAFVLAYTHLARDEGWRHTSVRFDGMPPVLRQFVRSMVRRRIKSLLWSQGLSRLPHEAIVAAALADWRAVLAVMSDGPYFFGEKATTTDAILFGALATTVLTPIESPIRDYLAAQPKCLAYVHRMRETFFPDLTPTVSLAAAAPSGRLQKGPAVA